MPKRNKSYWLEAPNKRKLKCKNAENNTVSMTEYFLTISHGKERQDRDYVHVGR